MPELERYDPGGVGSPRTGGAVGKQFSLLDAVGKGAQTVADTLRRNQQVKRAREEADAEANLQREISNERLLALASLTAEANGLYDESMQSEIGPDPDAFETKMLRLADAKAAGLVFPTENKATIDLFMETTGRDHVRKLSLARTEMLREEEREGIAKAQTALMESISLMDDIQTTEDFWMIGPAEALMSIATTAERTNTITGIELDKMIKQVNETLENRNIELGAKELVTMEPESASHMIRNLVSSGNPQEIAMGQRALELRAVYGSLQIEDFVNNYQNILEDQLQEIEQRAAQGAPIEDNKRAYESILDQANVQGLQRPAQLTEWSERMERAEKIGYELRDLHAIKDEYPGEVVLKMRQLKDESRDYKGMNYADREYLANKITFEFNEAQARLSNTGGGGLDSAGKKQARQLGKDLGRLNALLPGTGDIESYIDRQFTGEQREIMGKGFGEGQTEGEDPTDAAIRWLSERQGEGLEEGTPAVQRMTFFFDENMTAAENAGLISQQLSEIAKRKEILDEYVGLMYEEMTGVPDPEVTENKVDLTLTDQERTSLDEALFELPTAQAVALLSQMKTEGTLAALSENNSREPRSIARSQAAYFARLGDTSMAKIALDGARFLQKGESSIRTELRTRLNEAIRSDSNEDPLKQFGVAGEEALQIAREQVFNVAAGLAVNSGQITRESLEHHMDNAMELAFGPQVSVGTGVVSVPYPTADPDKIQLILDDINPAVIKDISAERGGDLNYKAALDIFEQVTNATWSLIRDGEYAFYPTYGLDDTEQHGEPLALTLKWSEIEKHVQVQRALVDEQRDVLRNEPITWGWSPQTVVGTAGGPVPQNYVRGDPRPSAIELMEELNDEDYWIKGPGKGIMDHMPEFKEVLTSSVGIVRNFSEEDEKMFREGLDALTKSLKGGNMEKAEDAINDIIEVAGEYGWSPQTMAGPAGGPVPAEPSVDPGTTLGPAGSPSRPSVVELMSELNDEDYWINGPGRGINEHMPELKEALTGSLEMLRNFSEEDEKMFREGLDALTKSLKGGNMEKAEDAINDIIEVAREYGWNPKPHASELSDRAKEFSERPALDIPEELISTESLAPGFLGGPAGATMNIRALTMNDLVAETLVSLRHTTLDEVETRADTVVNQLIESNEGGITDMSPTEMEAYVRTTVLQIPDDKRKARFFGGALHRDIDWEEVVEDVNKKGVPISDNPYWIGWDAKSGKIYTVYQADGERVIKESGAVDAGVKPTRRQRSIMIKAYKMWKQRRKQRLEKAAQKRRERYERWLKAIGIDKLFGN